MSWVQTDERMRIIGASACEINGWTKVDVDMTGWELYDGCAPVYKLKDGSVVRRTDQEIKRDKKNRT